MELHFAPMQGYVDRFYRRFHNEIFGGIDCYYTPFIRVEKGEPRRQDIARLRDSAGDGTPLVPQIIFKSAEEFGILAEAVKSLGFNRIDLNLGCPFPMQTGKGRGAAMILRTDVMEEVAAMINADTATAYSVKMRLGMTDAAQWEPLMPILNSMPLVHVALHPRIARQQYAGELDEAQFGRFLEQSTNPVIWNGEIHTPADIDLIASRYPGLKGVMIGRGLLARPSLAAEWRTGGEMTADERLGKILELHARLLEAYEATLCGPTQIMQKIKPFWEYLEPAIGHRAAKAIRKSATLPAYRTAVEGVK